MRALVTSKNNIKLNANELLFMEGDPGSEMYIIKSGTVRILKLEGSRMTPLCDLGPGSVIGEMSLLDNAPRSATARTLTVTELVIINQGLLNSAYAKLPGWLSSIFKILVQRLREANLLKTKKDAYNSLPTLVFLMLNLRTSQTNSYSVSLKQVVNEANTLYGLDEGTLKRHLVKLSKESFWTITKTKTNVERITIPDAQVLEALYSYLFKLHSGKPIIELSYKDNQRAFLQTLLEKAHSHGQMKEGVAIFNEKALHTLLSRDCTLDLDLLEQLVKLKIANRSSKSIDTDYGAYDFGKITIKLQELEDYQKFVFYLPKFQLDWEKLADS